MPSPDNQSAVVSNLPPLPAGYTLDGSSGASFSTGISSVGVSNAKPGPYVTSLSPDNEQKFKSWVQQNKIPWEDSPNADYDMRGFWQAQQSGDSNAVRSSANNHFPDTWKTPYHKTFSNESKYALPTAPHWEGGNLVPTSAVTAETSDSPSTPPLPAGYKMDEPSPDDYPWSKAYPFSPSDPGSRLARSFTEGSGLPADITKWRESIRSMGSDPLTGRPGPHGPSILNAPANIVKGIASGSASASQRGLEQFSQPGVVNKTVGGLKYIIGGLPIAGPAIVKSMEEAEKGNYAGMLGTLGSMGMQALIANPEAAATHLDAAGKYLFSKPKVQQTVLGGEALESLTHFKDLAKKETEAAYEPINKVEADPTVTVPGFRVADAFNKSLSDNMKGTDITPTPMKEIVNEGGLKSIGYMPNAQGQLREIFSKTSPDTPVTLKDLQGYYSELGQFMENGRLPGDVYRTAKQARESVGDMISDVYKEHSTPGTTDLLNSWEDAQKLYEDYATRFLDPDSPLVKAIDTANPYNHLAAADRPAATLAHLTGDNEALARSYLNRYRHLGANDDIVTAATRLQKGMDQMRIRGLYQASGGLLLAMMLREFGVPTAVNAATVATLLSSRLAKGYFNTRPSLTSLLSDEIKPSTWRAFPLKGGDTDIRGNQSPFSGGGGPVAQPPPPAPAPAATSTVDHSASTITPTESTFLSSISDHPSLHPDLAEDIKSITDPTRLKGIMDIMKYQKMGYNEATKIYDSINQPKPREGNVKINRLP